MRDKIEVHLHTNDNCNLKCIHCYNKSGEEAACNIPETVSLLELIHYFCTEYEAEIHLEGGEIFLRPELFRQMGSLTVEMLQCITITTNGTIRIDEPVIIDMLCKIHALRISVEGHTDGQQRTVRGIDLGDVVEHALFYREKGIPVWLRLTMTSQNYEHLLDETLPYYMNMGFRNFQVYEFQSVGRGIANRRLLAIEDHSFDSFLKKLSVWEASAAEGNLRLKFMFSGVRRKTVFSYKEQLTLRGMRVFDIPVENGVSIHADGSVFLCAWDNDENHCIFNVYRDGLKYIKENLKQMNLTHSCSHCSEVCIAY